MTPTPYPHSQCSSYGMAEEWKEDWVIIFSLPISSGNAELKTFFCDFSAVG